MYWYSTRAPRAQEEFADTLLALGGLHWLMRQCPLAEFVLRTSDALALHLDFWLDTLHAVRSSRSLTWPAWPHISSCSSPSPSSSPRPRSLRAPARVQVRGGRVPLIAGFWASGEEVSRAAGARDCVPRDVFTRRYYPNYLRAPVRSVCLATCLRSRLACTFRTAAFRSRHCHTLLPAAALLCCGC